MAYTITFVDRASRTYTLTLTTPTGSGTLNGGAATIETNEDADTDMFMPVRCQTGSFRYLGKNDHATWLNLIPANSLSIPVKLQRGSTVVWQGYIQPQVFENEYPGLGTVEHVFPIQCPLSVLDTIDIDPDPSTTINNNATITFGSLLQTYVFNRLTGTTISGFYVQGTKAVTEARLAVRVMWANFLTTDSNNSVVCKYTCKQVLEEFCKFFGYTCRMYGSYVYFSQPTEDTAYFTSFSALNGTGSSVARHTFNITGAMIANMDNHEQICPGVGKVTVKSDINKIDNLVEIPYDEIYDKYNLGVPTNSIIVRALDQGDEKIYYLIREPNSNGATLSYDNEQVSMSLFAAKVNDVTLTKNKYARFLVYDTSEVGDPETQEIPESKKSYGWSKCVELFHGTEYAGGSTATMFTITSKQTFVMAGGILYVSWKMRNTDAGQYKLMLSDHPATVTAQLRIGDSYWSGTWNRTTKEWNNGVWITPAPGATPPTFTMYLDADGPTTTRKNANAPQYDGCGIPVADTLRGILEFKVIDVAPWQGGIVPFEVDNNGFVPMHDFEIGFVRGTVEDTKHTGNEYTVKGGAFREEVNVDLIWASDVIYGQGTDRHMPAGLGYILDSNDRPARFVPSMAGSSVIPEQELARVIAAYGNRTHRVVKLTLRQSMVGAVVPTGLSSGLENGFFPLAVSTDWRDDTTTITLISL
jgi:hypothetical protein